MLKRKHIMQILIIAGVMLLSITASGCNADPFGKKNPMRKYLKVQSEIPEEECEAIIIAHLKEKYDEDFTIDYLGRLSLYCQYDGRATLVSEEKP